jgi:hypothetical protein
MKTIREEAGRKIDPANCEVAVVHGPFFDAYYVLPHLPGCGDHRVATLRGYPWSWYGMPSRDCGEGRT